jgi:hypothetical protein
MGNFIFDLHMKPIENEFERKNEIFDHFTILLCLYFIYWFTEYIPSKDFKFIIGWFAVGIMGVNITFRVSVALFGIVKNAINSVKALCNYCKNKDKAKQMKEFEINR